MMPTFVESLGGEPAWHWLEGESLVNVLHGTQSDTARDIVIAEADYSRMPFLPKLNKGVHDSNMTMAFDGRYKLFHHPGERFQLFDLEQDPDELIDLGEDPGYAKVREQLVHQMLDWSASLKNRTPVSAQYMKSKQGLSFRQGILIGFWSADDVPEPRNINQRLKAGVRS